MAGPNYDVGITFTAQGDLGAVLSALNIQMEKLATDAAAVSAAMSRASVSGGRKNNTSLQGGKKQKVQTFEEIANAQRKAQGKLDRGAAAEALKAAKAQKKLEKTAMTQVLDNIKARETLNGAAAARALTAKRTQGELDKTATARVLDDIKAQETLNGAAAARALTDKRAQEKLDKVTAARALADKRAQEKLDRGAAAKTLRDIKIRGREESAAMGATERRAKKRMSDMRNVLRGSGVYGGGRIGAVLGLAADPVVLGIAAVTAALVASTFGANEYSKALLSIETSGVGAAQAQKELSQALNARSGSVGMMAPTTAGAMLGYLNSIFPKTNIEGGGQLMATAASATEFLRSNYGASQVEASGQVMQLVESIKRGLSASGVDEASAVKKTPGILSAVMADVATMGPHAQQFIDATNKVLNDSLAVSTIGVANLPTYFNSIRGLVAGGMSSEDIDTMARVAGAGGLDKSTLLAMMSEGMSVKTMGMPSVIAGRTFGIGDPVAAALLRTDPLAYAGKYLYSGATGGVTLDAAQKLPEDKRLEMNKKALGGYKVDSWAYDAVKAAIVNYGFNDKKPNVDWPTLVNPLTTAMDKLRASTERLTIVIGSSVGVMAANLTAGAVDALTVPSTTFVIKGVPRTPPKSPAAGAAATPPKSPPAGPVDSPVVYYGGGHHLSRPDPHHVNNITIVANGRVDVKGNGAPLGSTSALRNMTNAGGTPVSPHLVNGHQ